MNNCCICWSSSVSPVKTRFFPKSAARRSRTASLDNRRSAGCSTWAHASSSSIRRWDVNAGLLSRMEQPRRSPHICWFLPLKYLWRSSGGLEPCRRDPRHLWGERDCTEIVGLYTASISRPEVHEVCVCESVGVCASVRSPSPPVREMRTSPLGRNLLWTKEERKVKSGRFYNYQVELALLQSVTYFING